MTYLQKLEHENESLKRQLFILKHCYERLQENNERTLALNQELHAHNMALIQGFVIHSLPRLPN